MCDKRALDLIAGYSMITFEGFKNVNRRKNTEHTIIITALLKFRKSNIHVGEYRPQLTQPTSKTKKCGFEHEAAIKFEVETNLL